LNKNDVNRSVFGGGEITLYAQSPENSPSTSRTEALEDSDEEFR
jgi:hypothetical protein